jgi:hypothetical protein
MTTEWRDWSPEQQRLFLRMYRHMRLNQSLYMPPGTALLPIPAWNVISGAAARMAAEMLDAEPSGDTFAATLHPEES